MKNILDTRENQQVPTEALVDLASLVLKNNVFEHNGKIYRQKQGTAMGTKFAPPYAITFMGEFEENALANFELKPFVWWRYIDDIFMVWQHGEEELLKFIEYLNSIHPTLKFTYSYSAESVDFLDVCVSKFGVTLKTDLFVKETDTHQYLHYNSCHTFHTKKGIPYGQALRFRRIIADDTQLDLECNKLISWFLNRGFPEHMVRQQVQRAKCQDRDSLLDYERTERDETTRPVCVLTYHPVYGKKVFDVFKSLQPLLQSDEEHARVFPEIPLVAFRRTKNLSDSLVRALVPNVQETPGCRGCHADKRCQCCKVITEATSFTSTTTGRTFQIRANDLHCNSTGIVYLLECKKCQIQNVGSTAPRFRLRVNNYRDKHREFCRRKAAGTLNRGTKVAQAELHAHFQQPDHNGFADFSFKLIDSAKNEADLRQRESFWQYKLATFSPQGLNRCDAPYQLEVHEQERFQ